MAYYPLRPVPLRDAATHAFSDWLAEVEHDLDRPDCDRNEFCRKILTELYFPTLAGRDPEELPRGSQVALLQMDPRNVTLEPEYYHEIDLERYARVKPLLWLWEMFDRSPIGENVDVGIRFRRILARRVFRSCGENFKAFPYVRLSFGYNLEVGNNVVVHRHVLLDDRGGIRLGNRVSVSDFANIYSHSHDIVDPCEVFTPTTVVEDGVRITYHATILAGVRVSEDSMVGAMALATKDTLPHHVHVGIPARPVKEKPRPGAAEDRPPDPLSGEFGE